MGLGASPFGYYRLPQFQRLLLARGVDVPDDWLWEGLPGPESQPCRNSAFDPAGGLKRPYLDRLTRVLARADELGNVTTRPAGFI